MSMSEASESFSPVLRLAMAELDSLIGLPSAKDELHRLTRFLKVQRLRESQGLPVASQALHFVFSGNPGTGKTTVARIVSRILCGLGLLKTSKLVECDQSQLVAGYVGHTAMKTNELIDSAMDGVLFIDEAYSLLPKGDENSFGKEAIDTLLKRMEDDRGRIVVVVAGYTEPMQRLLESNPGLRSRFTRFIHFDDYTPPELCRIFEKFCTDQQYELSAAARASLGLLFTLAYNTREGHFGNGRFVRNVFEAAINRHSDRIGKSLNTTFERSVLATLESADIPLDMVDASGFSAARVDLSGARWRCVCPACGKNGFGHGGQLGQLVACGCGQEFCFAWWGLVAETVKGVPLDLLSTSETWDTRGVVVPSKPRHVDDLPVDFVSVSQTSSHNEHATQTSVEIPCSRERNEETANENAAEDNLHGRNESPGSQSTLEGKSKVSPEAAQVPCPICGEPIAVLPSQWFKKVRCSNFACPVVYVRPSPVPGTSTVLKRR